MGENLKIAIVNYEVGNICSVKNAFLRMKNNEVLLTDDPETIARADVVVLPGVGAFSDAMKALSEKKLIPTLEHVAFEQKKPFLAICVGMQLLFGSSEEGGNIKGLSWIGGRVIKFKVPGLHVPHFGWNDIKITQPSPIFNQLSSEPNFYFAHSFHADCAKENIIATCNYGIDFPAIVKQDNIMGIQFHPEKSHSNGMLLIQNYLNSIKGKYA